ncbi:hypothetical protein LP419_25055 [Massilia sp. H-1]|nr:hypothetical protein LP419_25055 [Massilia sp. H-1]
MLVVISFPRYSLDVIRLAWLCPARRLRGVDHRFARLGPG